MDEAPNEKFSPSKGKPFSEIEPMFRFYFATLRFRIFFQKLLSLITLHLLNFPTNKIGK